MMRWLDALLDHRRRLGGMLRVGVLLLLVAVVGRVAGEISLPPITTVRFTSPFRHLDSAALQASLESRLQGHYLSVDVAALHAQLLTLPWVRSAHVRKRWPDTLEITLEEHEPLARWNEDGVISREGVLFHPPPDSIPEGLPWLRGVEPQLAAQALQRLQPLLAAHGGRVAELHRDARGALRLRPEGGPWLLLGREQQQERLSRWLAVQPLLTRAGLEPPQRVDLRYANGLALAAVAPF